MTIFFMNPLNMLTAMSPHQDHVHDVACPPPGSSCLPPCHHTKSTYTTWHALHQGPHVYRHVNTPRARTRRGMLSTRVLMLTAMSPHQEHVHDVACPPPGSSCLPPCHHTKSTYTTWHALHQGHHAYRHVTTPRARTQRGMLSTRVLMLTAMSPHQEHVHDVACSPPGSSCLPPCHHTKSTYTTWHALHQGPHAYRHVTTPRARTQRGMLSTRVLMLTAMSPHQEHVHNVACSPPGSSPILGELQPKPRPPPSYSRTPPPPPPPPFADCGRKEHIFNRNR